MSRWQALTIATFVVAIALAGASIAVAGLVYFSPAVYAALSPAVVPGLGISSTWLAAIVGAAGVAFALALVRVQQEAAGWFARRDAAEFQAQYRDIEAAHGTEEAEEYFASTMQRVMKSAGEPLDLFGANDVKAMAQKQGIGGN